MYDSCKLIFLIYIYRSLQQTDSLFFLLFSSLFFLKKYSTSFCSEISECSRTPDGRSKLKSSSMVVVAIVVVVVGSSSGYCSRSSSSGYSSIRHHWEFSGLQSTGTTGGNGQNMYSAAAKTRLALARSVTCPALFRARHVVGSFDRAGIRASSYCVTWTMLLVFSTAALFREAYRTINDGNQPVSQLLSSYLYVSR